jgi:hypothetical protein
MYHDWPQVFGTDEGVSNDFVVDRLPGTADLPISNEFIVRLHAGQRLVFLICMGFRKSYSILLGNLLWFRCRLLPVTLHERCLIDLLDRLPASAGTPWRMNVCGSGLDLCSTSPYSWGYLASRWGRVNAILQL